MSKLKNLIKKLSIKKGKSITFSFNFKKVRSFIASYKPQIFAVLLVFVTLSLFFYFKSVFVVAMVNGKPVSRLSVIKDLEKQSGKETLNTIISKKLILQEAKKKNITVDKQEIEKEIKVIEDRLKKQGQNLDTILKFQGLTRKDVFEQTKMQILLKKLLGKDIEVTEDEISKYIEENKKSLPSGIKEAELNQNIKQMLENKKFNNKVQTLLQTLKEKANIKYFINY